MHYPNLGHPVVYQQTRHRADAPMYRASYDAANRLDGGEHQFTAQATDLGEEHMTIVASGQERYKAIYECADEATVIAFSDAESREEAQEEMLAYARRSLET